MECNHAERVSNPHWHYDLTIQSHITHHSPLNLPWGAKSAQTHKYEHTYTLHTLECSPNTHIHATFPRDLKALFTFFFFKTHTPLAEQIIQRGGPVNNTNTTETSKNIHVPTVMPYGLTSQAIPRPTLLPFLSPPLPQGPTGRQGCRCVNRD